MESTRPWPKGNPRPHHLKFNTIKETEEWLAKHPEYYESEEEEELDEDEDESDGGDGADRGIRGQGEGV